MNRARLVWLAIISVLFVSLLNAADALKPVALSSVAADPQAEKLLLEMANEARAKAGLAPLRKDEGLAEAARAHPLEQVEQQRISHQLPGEPGLAQRLSKSTGLHLQRGGENVASAASVAHAHASLMASPPHRENLLDPAYNISGFGVVRSGHLLYVTQDFGRGVTTYSAEKSEQLIARNIVDARHRSRLVRLRELDGKSARDAACQMAGENTIKTHVSREMKQSTYLVRYTSQDPETLPSGAGRAIADAGRSFFRCRQLLPPDKNLSQWRVLGCVDVLLSPALIFVIPKGFRNHGTSTDLIFALRNLRFFLRVPYLVRVVNSLKPRRSTDEL